MNERDRRALATTGVGGTLVALGGHQRHLASEAAVRATGGTPNSFKRPAMVRRGVPLAARGRWGAGTALGLVGGTGLAVGVTDLAQRKRFRKAAPLLYEGLEGTREAFSDRVHNARQPKDPRAVAAPYAIGAGAGLGGGQLAHKIIDRAGHGALRGWGGRHGAVAVAGTLAAASSLPLSRRAVNRITPDYEVTPTGVRRKKRKPIPPSRSANTVEMRSKYGARPNVRGQVVPSDPRYGVNKTDDYDRTALHYRGSGMTARQKRARVYASGAAPLPFVGPVNAARTAAKYAPPDQRRSAAALQLGGVTGGVTLGAAGGAYGSAALTRRSPHVGRQILAADAALTRGKQHLRSKVDPHLPARLRGRGGVAEGPGRASRALTRMENSGGRAGRTISAAARPLRGVGRVPFVGGYAGKVAGGLVGGYAGYGHALRREEQRRDRLQGRSSSAVRKLDATGMTRREQVEQYRRRKRNVGFSVASTATGAAGVGALALSHGTALPRIGASIARNQAKIERFGLGTALAGGGVGSVQGAQSIGIQRRDLAAQERRLRIKPEVEKGIFGDLGDAARKAQRASVARAAARVDASYDKLPRYASGHEHAVIGDRLYTRRAPGLPWLEDARVRGVAEQNARQHARLGSVRRDSIDKGLNLRNTRRVDRLVEDMRDFRHPLYGRAIALQSRAKKPGSMFQQADLRNTLRRHAGHPALDRRVGKAMLVPRKATFRASFIRRTATGPSRVRNTVSKIETTMSTKDAHSYAQKYGTKGPLPRGLERDEKMRAYEGRYIAAGGPKGEKWKRRADRYDRVTGGALAVGGASLAGQAAHDTRIGNRVATKVGVRNHALVHQRATKLGLAAGGVGALSELAHRHAEHRQAKYSNSAAGVAASALRRMRDYTPD